VAQIISHLSEMMSLQPGDVIATRHTARCGYGDEAAALSDRGRCWYGSCRSSGWALQRQEVRARRPDIFCWPAFFKGALGGCRFSAGWATKCFGPTPIWNTIARVGAKGGWVFFGGAFFQSFTFMRRPTLALFRSAVSGTTAHADRLILSGRRSAHCVTHIGQQASSGVGCGQMQGQSRPAAAFSQAQAGTTKARSRKSCVICRKKL